MLRKPDKDDPLPAFGRDDDESASTGEFRPLKHDVRSREPRANDRGGDAVPLPSFSDELPRFPSMVDPRERDAPSSVSSVSPVSPVSARARAQANVKSPRPVAADADVAATLEKRPVTANAANRILAQLDRQPVRADSTGEIDLEDVLEEVYAAPLPRVAQSVRQQPSEPPPASRREPPRTSDRPAPSSPPRMVPPSPPSFTGAELPLPERAPASVSQPASWVPPPMVSGYGSAPPPPGYAPNHAPPSHAQPVAFAAYAPTVPAGYVLVPQGSQVMPSSQSYGLAPQAELVRPLPLAVEAPSGSGVLGKVLAGTLILGLSALAGGAASIWLVPDKAPPPPPIPSASAPMVPVASTSPNPLPIVQPSAPPAPVASSPTPVASVLTPTGGGWPLAPATVPPGAGSMAPPPPRASENAPAPSGLGTLPEGSGRIVFGPARLGHRVWIDGTMVGESTGPLVVKCGKRTLRIGSNAGGQSVDVPCGGDVVVK